MIYSPGKFIFIKPKKVAGTSMEILLSAACNEHCTITPVGLREEILRYNLGCQLPVNVFPSKDREKEFHRFIASAAPLENLSQMNQNSGNQENSDYILSEKLKEEFVALKRGLSVRNHCSPSRAKKLIDRTELNRIIKISICRHPYELAVSQAYWNIRDRKHVNQDFQDELDDIVSKEHDNNRHYFAEDFDYNMILRLEYLKADLKILQNVCQLDLPAQIPHAKGRTRKNPRSAAKILTWAQRRKMRNSNPRLFELWEHPPHT